MKEFTLDDLKKMSSEDRAVLYENAKRLRDSGGQRIIDLIDTHGLSLSDGGMRASDPIFIEMTDITWSAAGKSAAVAATERGLPALAGIEPLFVAAIGQRYHPHDGGTINAGFIVAELMRHLGYVENGQGNMPEGSVAKTAMKWKVRS